MLPEDAEPIFVKNGFVTDSSYTNLVFESDDGFFTPDSPLLEGTKRAALLDSGLIKSIAININSLSRYNKVHLINSMNDLGESTYDIDKVILKKLKKLL
ncbi:MAG: hypothetical protein RBT61_11275 [Candidatus Kapabacteria bacterium]|jgi:4-amino-4-deoxychorismate lyase|nr:hypothetical protein [Candidatus Kapabacteria bacterium]